jgi:hypothetical protein
MRRIAAIMLWWCGIFLPDVNTLMILHLFKLDCSSKIFKASNYEENFHINIYSSLVIVDGRVDLMCPISFAIQQSSDPEATND